MSPALQQEIFKLALRSLLGAVVGLWLGHAVIGFLVGLSAYLLMHLRYLNVLRQWFEAPKQVELPEPGGLWGEVFENLLELQRSNRKRKKKLAAILAEFQASTEALPDAAVVLSARGEIAWFNSAARSLLGLRNPQDVGQRLPNLIRHPDFIDYFTKGAYEGEVEAPSPVRTNHMLSYRIVPYGNGQRLLVARDISDARRLEAMRRDFVSNASHELRTPLTVLKGWLEMMGAEDAKGELAPWSTPLREMYAQTQRMENLVNDLLKLARLEADGQSLRNDPLPVSNLVQRVVDDAKAMSKGRHPFHVEIAPNLTLLGREVELLSVFSNLVANAVQYTPDGAEIAVRLFLDAQGLHYLVRDSGIGISEGDLPRLTERFYRVDVGRSRASGGTGLGLSIVKHALERHDASLRISSVLGKGSEFHCIFPLQRVVMAADNSAK